MNPVLCSNTKFWRTSGSVLEPLLFLLSLPPWETVVSPTACLIRAQSLTEKYWTTDLQNSHFSSLPPSYKWNQHPPSGTVQISYPSVQTANSASKINPQTVSPLLPNPIARPLSFITWTLLHRFPGFQHNSSFHTYQNKHLKIQVKYVTVMLTVFQWLPVVLQKTFKLFPSSLKPMLSFDFLSLLSHSTTC